MSDKQEPLSPNRVAEALEILAHPFVVGNCFDATAIAALELVQKLRDLHKRPTFGMGLVVVDACETCGQRWPCPTIALIEGS